MRSFFSTLPSVLIFTALASISLVDAAQRSGYCASHQHTLYNFGLGFASACTLSSSYVCPRSHEIGGSRMCHRRRMRQQSSITQAEITCTIRTNGTDWGDYPFIHHHWRIRYRYSSLRKMAYAPHVGVLAATFLYSSSFPGHTDVRKRTQYPSLELSPRRRQQALDVPHKISASITPCPFSYYSTYLDPHPHQRPNLDLVPRRVAQVPSTHSFSLFVLIPSRIYSALGLGTLHLTDERYGGVRLRRYRGSVILKSCASILRMNLDARQNTRKFHGNKNERAATHYWIYTLLVTE
ncbi:hypothetical protein B0H14DRAFT_2625962 [Mycena olivaceomarginata]|nr:hypothetical protein B0H14DRAFT_2625962 [Mycena olivaceomarginata]